MVKKGSERRGCLYDVQGGEGTRIRRGSVELFSHRMCCGLKNLIDRGIAKQV